MAAVNKNLITIFYHILPDVHAEKTQKSLFAGIESFDATKLKHAETCEKNPLPDTEGKLQHYKSCQQKVPMLSLLFYYFAAIQQEKGQNNFIKGIESFDTSKLKHTETCEKNPLPTKETIEEEKKS